MINQSRLLGLLIGAVIGGLYAWWQLRALARHERVQREQGQAPKVTAMIPGSITRVAMLLIALVLVQVLDREKRVDRIWLMVSLAAAYSIPFFWRLWLLYSQRK
jgi:hypothetical protein